MNLLVPLELILCKYKVKFKQTPRWGRIFVKFREIARDVGKGRKCFLPSEVEEGEGMEVTSHPTSRYQPFLLVMRFLQGHDRLKNCVLSQK